MKHALAHYNDTIVAIATPAGVGAIAVLRLSGADSFKIMRQLFPAKDLELENGFTIHFGLIKHKEEAIDEVLVSVFKAPKSYTGEHSIEISCHGSVYIQQKILEACIAAGARMARPGEFTQRAFLNGKIDLTQAEAVADLIASNTGAAQKNALHNVRGGFSEQLKNMREQLITFAALIELELDFATEDVEFADRTKFFELITSMQQHTASLLNSFTLGNVIKHGVSAAIIGKPNAGKSTLLNSLLNESRAIVSDIAGTTRDTIEETLNIKGILFRLIDTAGIRSHTADVIEGLGIEKSKEKMKQADIVLYIFDAANETVESLQEQINEFKTAQINYLLVANKTDLKTIIPDLPHENILKISAKEKQGITSLEEALYNSTVAETLTEEGTIVSNTRHFEALQNLQTHLQSIEYGLQQNLSGDLLTGDINNALYQLGEITGEITNEDKLDYIFSKFCIGK